MIQNFKLQNTNWSFRNIKMSALNINDRFEDQDTNQQMLLNTQIQCIQNRDCSRSWIKHMDINIM